MISALQSLTVAYGPLMLWAAGFAAWCLYMVRAAQVRADAEAKFADDRRATKSFVALWLPYSSNVLATERALPEMKKR